MKEFKDFSEALAAMDEALAWIGANQADALTDGNDHALYLFKEQIQDLLHLHSKSQGK